MNPTTQGFSIVVVDDVETNLTFLTDLLEASGHSVRTYLRGKDAIEGVRAAPPDLILLDVTMPGMDGYTVCERLKADETVAAVPVIFISGHDEMLDKVRAFGSGGVDYLTKPVQCDELLARVGTHARLHRLQMDLGNQNKLLEKMVEERTRELEEAHARLSILDQTKSDFLQLIAHELRTPLGGVVGFAELAFDRCESDPRMKELRDHFLRAKERLISILDDALLLTQIEVSSDRYGADRVPLRELVGIAVCAVTGYATSREVSFAVGPPCEVTVIGNRELLVKAVCALLETAVKFTVAGQAVAIATRVEGSRATVTSTSSGLTVPEHAIGRFFDVFSIAEPITPGGDLGLGPPLARRILGLFGGGATVANRADSRGVILEARLNVQQAQ